MTLTALASGKTTKDYAHYRKDYPNELFQKLQALGIGKYKQHIVDLDTGTGSLARGFAKLGCQVIGLDPSEALLKQASRLNQTQNLNIEYRLAHAEKTNLADHCADVVTAGNCWHWFNQNTVLSEAHRILSPYGYLLICHCDWLPGTNHIAAETEALIKSSHPNWRMHNDYDFTSRWLPFLYQTKFENIETFSFDIHFEFSHHEWRGRIRTSLDTEADDENSAQIQSVDARLNLLLREKFPQAILKIPHRVFAITARAPGFNHLLHSKNTLHIRSLTATDNVPWDLFNTTDFSKNHVKNYLQNAICKIAYLNANLIGIYVLKEIARKHYEIINIAVIPNLQRQGIGKKLIEHAINEVKKLGGKQIDIGVRNSRPHQLKLFQQCGFEFSYIERGYYTAQHPQTIIENGIICKDKIILSQTVNQLFTPKY